MSQAKLNLHVRHLSAHISVIDIQGDVTGTADAALTDAYNRASSAKLIVLNFTGLEYLNSSGIGLLVTLLIRAQRHGQQLTAYGLTDHYREIFELTRLNEAILLFASEADVLAAQSGSHS